jgi:hypothetical protein
MAKITVEFEVDEYSNNGLCELLRAIKYCGSAGASRVLKYWCDGDGSSPQINKVTIDGKEVPCNQLPGSDNWKKLID